MRQLLRRVHRHTPPHFDGHYDKEYKDGRWNYLCVFMNAHMKGPVLLEGANEWFDYMGDIVPVMADDLERELAKIMKPKVDKMDGLSLRKLNKRKVDIRITPRLGPI